MKRSVNKGNLRVKGAALPRSLLLATAVSLWGSRLAGFLFERILKSPKDPRLEKFIPNEGEKWFDKTKANFPVSLAGFWTIQAAWAWVVSLPVTLAIFSPANVPPVGIGGAIAFSAFAGGLIFEAVADNQKRNFKKDPANEGKWIDTGVWSVSRHPNYFGEIVVWASLFGLSLPALRGPRQIVLGLASPLFVTCLLLYVSGIPMLEKKMQEKHGDNAAYKKYKQDTPLLVPYCKWFPLPGVPY